MFPFYTIENIKSILNNNATKNRFCSELKIDSGFCDTQCGHLIRFVLSSLSYCFFMATILLFLLGFYFYGSGIFIVPLGFVGDIEEAKFGAVLY